METKERTWKAGSPEKTKRNQELHRRWKKGDKLIDLADEFNIAVSTAHRAVFREERRSQAKN